ncbi:ankyrin repeat domain-containing protein [Helicobacter sp. 23-1045]
MNREDMNWNEILLESAKNNNFEKVKESIENGADIGIKNNNGKTALDYAKPDAISSFF